MDLIGGCGLTGGGTQVGNRFPVHFENPLACLRTLLRRGRLAHRGGHRRQRAYRAEHSRHGEHDSTSSASNRMTVEPRDHRRCLVTSFWPTTPVGRTPDAKARCRAHGGGRRKAHDLSPTAPSPAPFKIDYDFDVVWLTNERLLPLGEWQPARDETRQPGTIRTGERLGGRF